MILATHQPIFLPWPGFFSKAMQSDCMVLLDCVQFPRGRSWMNRNRLKNETGTLWLTVPVRTKGRGLQSIRDVEICDERGWRRKHLRSIQQNYVHAPYFDEHHEALARIYEGDQALLVDFNIDLIQYFWRALSIRAQLLLQSDLGIDGAGTDLLARICEHQSADRLALFPAAEKYVDSAELGRRGVQPVRITYLSPIYPQLWGEFIYNLSILDLLLNCGPMSTKITAGASRGHPAPPAENA
jgi:hypothetical protein